MRVFNFSPGPAMMPEAVLSRAAQEMLDYGGQGMSVMEMSHRSKAFISIADNTEAALRRVMQIPDNYKVLFLQGGATLQFSMVPMNLMARTGKADYILTGNFSNSAYKAAGKYGQARVAGSSKDREYAYIPRQEALEIDKEASYLHYCYNNTVYGSVWDYIPDSGDVPLVCDMSSGILSRPIDVSQFGIIYAGAQKNMGPSGLTVVIIREDLAGKCLPCTPDIMDYQVQIDKQSMLNTPPCYGIYLLGLTLDWVEELGGLGAMARINEEKAALIYDVIDSGSFYLPFIDKPYRSLMNITFKNPSEELDARFVKEAAQLGLVNLKGYRTMGGIRASVYNAMPMAGAQKLAGFMKEFAANNQ